MFKFLGGIDMVAAYVLLLGVAGTVMTFLDAGIFAYAYPALIQHQLRLEQLQLQAQSRLQHRLQPQVSRHLQHRLQLKSVTQWQM